MSSETTGRPPGGHATTTHEVEITWLPSVEFKLADSYDLPASPGPLLLGSLLPQGHPLNPVVGARQVRSVFVTTTPAQLQHLVDRARAIDPTYHPPKFANLLQVQTPDVDIAREVASTLRQLPYVDFAEVRRVVPLPGVVTPVDDPLSTMQTHHGPRPNGIDSRAAWNLGASGAGVMVVDLERGYEQHEDLPAISPVYVEPSTHIDEPHGTAVLGLVAGGDNDVGGLGVAPGVSVGFAMRYWGSVDDERLSDAVIQSLLRLQYGDVLLVDDQYGLHIDGSTYTMPIEVHPVFHVYLKIIEVLGIVLVQPSGNGSNDIDPYTLPRSSAIIVGGINATSFKREDYQKYSNYGARVDLHAIYENITTSGWDANLYPATPGTGPMHSLNAYTRSFRGTSGTSAIVAGAAALVQSYAVAKAGYRLSPAQILAYLRTTGNDSGDPAADQVGRMPDLSAALPKISAAWPMIVRERETENPLEHVPRPACGDSPDLIIRFVPGPDPVPPFGAFEGLEGDSDPLEAGPVSHGLAQVRTRSTGSRESRMVSARVYACRPSFMPRPEHWIPIGRTWIGDVPGNGEFRLSAPMPWDLGPVFEWGGASLITVLDAARNPGPSPHGIRGEVEARRFYLNNTIVAVLTRLIPLKPWLPPFQNARRLYEFPVVAPLHSSRRVSLHLKYHGPTGESLQLILPAAFAFGPPGDNPDDVVIPVPAGEHGVRTTLDLEPGTTVRCRVSAPATGQITSFHATQYDGDEEWGCLAGFVPAW